MSPRMFYALLRAREDLERRIDARFGVVASVIANVNRDAKQKAFVPGDFFASLQVEQTEEEQAEILDAWSDVLEEPSDQEIAVPA